MCCVVVLCLLGDKYSHEKNERQSVDYERIILPEGCTKHPLCTIHLITGIPGVEDARGSVTGRDVSREYDGLFRHTQFVAVYQAPRRIILSRGSDAGDIYTVSLPLVFAVESLSGVFRWLLNDLLFTIAQCRSGNTEPVDFIQDCQKSGVIASNYGK